MHPSTSTKRKKILRRTLKILGWFLASLLVLVIVVVVLLQFPAVQTRLTQMIITSLSEQTQTHIGIDRVVVRFPKSVGLRGVYMEDTQGDTLLYAQGIFVDVGMTGLLRNKVNINRLSLEGVTAYMVRADPDTVFNYQFLLDAFGSETNNEPEPDQEPSDWEINVGQITLSDFRFVMADHFSGMELDTYINEFSTDLRPADIMNERYHTGNTRLDGARLRIAMHPPSMPAPDEEPQEEMAPLNFASRSIEINDFSFSLSSYEGSQIQVEIGNLALVPDNIILHENILELTSLEIYNLIAELSSPAIASDQEPETVATDMEFDFAEIMPWTLRLDNFAIHESSITMQQGTADHNPNTFNPENISLQNINLYANNIFVSPHDLKIQLTDSRMVFSDQFALEHLSANINLGSNTRIDNFNLQTTSSQIHFSFYSPDNFLRFNQDELYNYMLDLNIVQVNIQGDLAYLAPEMNEYYFNWPDNQGLKAEGNLKGRIRDLTLANITITGPDYFEMNVDGRLTGLPDIENLFVDIPDFRLWARPARIMANLHDTLQPEGINVPDFVRIHNQTRGNLQDLQTKLNIHTDFGDISFTAFLDDPPDAPAHFKGEFITESFNIGELLNQQETFPQPLSFDLDFDGRDRDPHRMNLEVNARLGQLMLNNYAYDDLIFLINLKDSVITAVTSYEDEYLSFSLEGSYGMFANVPGLLMTLDIPYADLHRIGFSEEEMLVKTNLKTDVYFNVDDFFNGIVRVQNTSIATEEHIFDLPEVVITSLSQPDDYNMQLTTRFAEMDFRGNISPTLIPELITQHIRQYYGVQIADQTLDTIIYSQFELGLTVIEDDFITNVLVPGLEHFETLTLKTSYNSQTRELLVEAQLPQIIYENIEVDQFLAFAVSDDSRMDFGINMNKLVFQETELHAFSLDGLLIDEILHFSFAIQDQEQQPLYSFEGVLEQIDTLYQVHIRDTELLINREFWDIPSDNYIVFGNQYLDVHNFVIESQGRMLSVSNRDHDLDYPIVDVAFRQIDLGRLTDISGTQLPQIGGLFEGDLSLIDIFGQPSFIANLTIDDFSFQGDTIGNIVVIAENPRENFFEVFATVTNQGTELEITGNYQSGEEIVMDIDVNLARLDLPSFEGFTAGNLTHLAGYLSGQMNLSGSPQQPVIAGELMMNDVAFRVPAINVGYFLKSERIVFDRQNIRLQNIALIDSTGRSANLNGSINFSDMEQISFNINLNSRNFLLMNLQPGQNDMYSGRILVDTDLRLRGDQTKPTIDGRLRLNEGSNFAFTLPRPAPDAIGDEGIVEFVQFRDTLFYQMAGLIDDTPEVRSSFELLDLSINLEINPQTDVTIIIDEHAGDFLQVQGGGTLSLGIDPGGRVSLTGQYEIAEGEYLLTFYDVVRRNFLIQSGSTITWAGDPLDAQINITALHTVRTSPANLMMGLTGGGQAENAGLRRQYPFLVSLNMNGNLMEPQIGFELGLPQEHQNAFDGALAGRLNQINQNESELNKQVFAVLILGTFIQDNPLESLGGGGGFSATARSSVSQFLSQQLNRFSDRFIRGVDINFEVESFEDFDNGQTVGRTELQMEVSRNFFDERVRVTVGGNIELEDETRRERDPGDIAGDFAIEYLLTPEGNLLLKGFRSKNYTDIFDGQVIETGIALMFSRSYNQFRELFERNRVNDDFPADDDVK